MTDRALIDQDARKCSCCGTCLIFCPVLMQSGIESFGPRGKAVLCKSYLNGDLTRGVYFQHIFSLCTLCGGCAELCPSGIAISHMVLMMRAELVRGNLPFWGSNAMKIYKSVPQRLSSLLLWLQGRFKGRIVFGVWSFLVHDRKSYDSILRLVRFGFMFLPKESGMVRALPYPMQGWTRQRYFKAMPQTNFKERWEKLQF